MLKSITITNLGSFQSLTVETPSVCLINGGNGVGKTTLLDVVRLFADRGHDPDILRGNSENGEAVMVLDDETQIRVRVTRKDTWRGWKPKDAKRWVEGREMVDKIYRAIAYDPIKFLDLPPKEQAEKLAELSPVQATEAELQLAVGGATEERSKAPVKPGMNGIEVINTIREAIYDARGLLNNGAKVQDAHASELEKALPSPAPAGTDWKKEASRLASERSRIEDEERKAIGLISADFQAAKDTANAENREQWQKINTDIDTKIAALELERQERKQASADAYTLTVETARTKANTDAAAIKSANKPVLEKLTADYATAAERDRFLTQAEGTRKAAEVARNEAEQKKSRAKELTEALTRLDNLKRTLAARLPIKNVIVQDGKIYREQDGGLVPLKRWNTADQYKLCLKIGMMIGGGLVLVDHCEAFDGPTRKALYATCQKYAEDKGVQFLLASVDIEGKPLKVASVSDGPLEVKAP